MKRNSPKAKSSSKNTPNTTAKVPPPSTNWTPEKERRFQKLRVKLGK